MQTETFTVQNVKCGGCTSNIQQGLLALEGVEKVEASIDSGMVTVSGTQSFPTTDCCQAGRTGLS